MFCGSANPLRRPTADAVELVHAADVGMNAICGSGINFAKAEVMLVDLHRAKR